MDDGVILYEIRNARNSEEPPAAMDQALSALGAGGHHMGVFQMLMSLFGPKSPVKMYSLELIAVNSGVHFLIAVPAYLLTFVESQLSSQYPKVVFNKVGDYVPHFLKTPHAVGQLVLTNSFYLPLRTYRDVRDLDLSSSVVGQLAKLPSNEAVAVQMRLSPAGSGWQSTARHVIEAGIPDPTAMQPGRTKSHPQAKLIEAKMNQIGFSAAIRILAAAENKETATHVLHTIAGTFGVYAFGDANGLALSEPSFWQVGKLESAFLARSGDLAPRFQVLGSAELATMWHPPGLGLSAIKNISWGSYLSSDAPENLPISTDNEEEKKQINFFARTEYKNRNVTFGLKKDDRRKHLYVIGKTGTGKSTMIANMAINDMKNGEGMAVIDPHGDLCDVMLDYVPSYRINDVAYLDPSDLEYPFHLNPLEVKNPAFRELVSSGIVSIFYKLYHYSWGPRLEYILRNTILTLLYVPQSTLLQVPELLTNEQYRSRIVEKLADPVLKNFWNYEFDKMSPQMRSEAVSPILNKVGQFLSSQTVRNIVGKPVSTIDLEDMMNEGKIIIVNLSQGKLGEDNSSLLGAMIITKMQLAAMNRVYLAEEKRRDFYLYVDEFQNFATNSFIKILSEARKYRLSLMLANQYIGQIDEEVQSAIFGNAGSLVCFGVGGGDARMLSKEFGEKYAEDELVGLGNYQTILKLSIDNHTSLPFTATTLPLPRSINQNREKVIRSSRERYAKRIG